MNDDDGAGIRISAADKGIIPFSNVHKILRTLSFPRVATTFWSLYSNSLQAPKVWQHHRDL